MDAERLCKRSMQHGNCICTCGRLVLFGAGQSIYAFSLVKVSETAPDPLKHKISSAYWEIRETSVFAFAHDVMRKEVIG